MRDTVGGDTPNIRAICAAVFRPEITASAISRRLRAAGAGALSPHLPGSPACLLFLTTHRRPAILSHTVRQLIVLFPSGSRRSLGGDASTRCGKTGPIDQLAFSHPKKWSLHNNVEHIGRGEAGCRVDQQPDASLQGYPVRDEHPIEMHDRFVGQVEAVSQSGDCAHAGKSQARQHTVWAQARGQQ